MTCRIPPIAALIAFALAAAATPASAHDYGLDQSHEPPSMNIVYSVKLMAPIGQEFVPTHSKLDVVELWLTDGSSGQPWLSAQVQVRIRRTDWNGEVLGTSEALTLTGEYDQAFHFDFPAPVEVTPGETYVLEALHVGGEANPMLGCNEPGTYAAGRGFVSETYLTNSDFWFRTGVDPTVPAAPTSWGDVKRRYR